MVEPWLRGTLAEIDAVRRQVLHAMELAVEDAERWCAPLSEAEIHARPFELPSVAFHMLHIARSLDRLLTYAEARPLSQAQMDALNAEMTPGKSCTEIVEEFRSALASARIRVMQFDRNDFEQARGVGRAMLPSTVGGLLVHCAEHTQRHAGQMVTTAKVVLGIRAESAGTPPGADEGS